MKNIRFTHIALIGAIALFAASCNESELTSNDQIYRPLGSKIEFSAATSYDNGPVTRAEYSGIPFNVTGYTNPFERIDWKANDPIKIIYNGTPAEFAVDQVLDPQNEKSFAKINGSLYWGTAPHVFYALYPSGGTAAGGLAAGGAMTGFIPAEQPVDPDNVLPVNNSDDGSLIYNKYQPNTKEYGYMVAYKEITASSTESTVNLYFKPAFTTFEFKLKMKEGAGSVKVLSAVLKSEDGDDGSDMAGNFGLTIIPDPDHEGMAKWESVNVDATSATRSITVGFGTEGVLIPTEDQAGYLDFSILTLPVDQKGLTLQLNLADGSSKSIKFKDDRTPGQPNSGTWHTFTGAKKYIITNEYVPGEDWVYTLTEVDPLTGEPVAVTDITAGGVPTGHGGHIGHYPKQVREKPFKSYKTKVNSDPVERKLVDVKIEFAPAAEDGSIAGEWSETMPEWLTKYEVTVKPEETAPFDIWTSQAKYDSLYVKVLNEGLEGLDQYETFNEIKDHKAILRADGRNNSANFSSSKPQDLALYEIDALTGTPRDKPKTANCYVVDRKGWYMFPLVYGNAIDWDHSPAHNGWNPSSVRDNGSGLTGIQTYRLPHFQNFIGQPIRSPYILDDINSTESLTGLTVDDVEAVIVWEDTKAAEPFITASSVEIVTSPNTSAVYYESNGTTAKVVPYIKFQVNDNIMQGNALIALREKNGSKRIIWSWHIWITDLDMGTVNVPLHAGSVVTNNDMMKYNLGWCDMRIGRMYSYVPRVCWARISHDDAASNCEPLVFKITEVLDPYYTLTLSSGTYYQMGRKDPFLPGTSNEGLTWGDNITTAPQYGNYELSVEPHTSGTVPPLYINKDVYDPNTFGVTSSATTIPSPAVTSAQNDMVHTIQNPYRFFSRDNNSTIGWLFDRRPYNLWNMYNHSQGYNNGNLEYYYTGGLTWYSPHYEYDQIVVKTVYDPCPPGFCVPNYTGFTGFSTTGYNLAYRDGSGVHESDAKWVPEDAETFPDIELYGDYRYYFDTNDGSRTICFPSHGYRDSDLNNSPVGGLFGGVYYMTAQKKGDRYVVCLSGYGPMGAANGRSVGYAVRAIREQPRPDYVEYGGSTQGQGVLLKDYSGNSWE